MTAMKETRKRLSDKQFNALIQATREAQEAEALASIKRQAANTVLELVLDAHGCTVEHALRVDDKTKELVIAEPVETAPPEDRKPPDQDKHMPMSEYLDSQ